MAGTLVEYARFVEVQQRRARVVEELRLPPPETPPYTRVSAAVDDQPVDASVTRGVTDVR